MIGPWGMNASTRAFGGGAKAAGSLAAVVAITATGSSAGASSAVDTSNPSFWYAVDAETSTIGRVSGASQAGGSAGGSQVTGPTSRTDGGQSPRGYSYGSAVSAMKRSAASHCSS